MKKSYSKLVRFAAATVLSSGTRIWLVAGMAAIAPGAGVATRGWAQEPAQPQAQQRQGPKINWQDGPTTANLGDIGEIKIPEGYRFAGKEGAQKLLQASQTLGSR